MYIQYVAFIYTKKTTILRNYVSLARYAGLCGSATPLVELKLLGGAIVVNI